MTDFLNSLVDRFTSGENVISPRLPGRFEPDFFPNQVDQLDESIVQNESIPVLSEKDNSSGLKDERERHFDNKNNKDQLNNNDNFNNSLIRDQKAIVSNPVNEEVQSNFQQQENGSNQLKTFIHPSGIGEKRNEYFPTEIAAKDKSEEISSSNNLRTPDFLDLQVEKEKQRNKIDNSHHFPLNSEQYFATRNESKYNDFYEPVENSRIPIIKISIGRIEVRAVPSSNNIKAKESLPQRPRLTLEEYLQKRNSSQ